MITIRKLSDEFSTSITGFLSPFRQDNQPHLVEMPMDKYLWATVFSDVEKLKESCKFLGVFNYKIKQIEDGEDFANSLFEHNIRIMLNPYIINDNGIYKTRWTEIQKGAENG